MNIVALIIGLFACAGLFGAICWQLFYQDAVEERQEWEVYSTKDEIRFLPREDKHAN